MARVQFMTGNYLAFKVFQQSYKHVPTILHQRHLGIRVPPKAVLDDSSAIHSECLISFHIRKSCDLDRFRALNFGQSVRVVMELRLGILNTYSAVALPRGFESHLCHQPFFFCMYF